MQGTLKEIKRAYARELKLLDIEKNPEAFQKLREAYEAALKSAHQPEPGPATSSSPAPAPDPQPVPVRIDAQPACAPAAPIESVPQLIAQLERRVAAIANGRIADDELLWKDEIRAQIDILRPLALDAQEEFERQVGILLLGGWKHGHEALLVAASEVFGWNEAGWRWDHLGRSGATLNAALALRHCLEHFEASEHRHFRYVIRDLRQQFEPTKEALRRDLPYAEFLEAHFSPLLAILIPPGRVDAWRRALQKPEPTPMLQYLVVILMGLTALFYALKSLHRGAYPERPAAPVSASPPAEAVDRTSEAKALTAAQRQLILYGIRQAEWRAASPVRYDVILDSIGRPHEVTLLQSSGVVADDYAAAEAIRGIKRYPAHFPRRFTFSR